MHKTRDGKIRRSEHEWRVILQQLDDSGIPRLQFCHDHGISLASLQRWEKRLRPAQPKPQTQTPFVEITPSETVSPVPLAAAAPAPTWLAELQLPNGCVLRIGS